MVGNYAQGTSLRDVMVSFKWIIHDAGNRRHDQLCGMATDDAFLLLDKILYGNSPPDPMATLEMPARFNVTAEVDVFDSWKIFMVSCDAHDRLMYKDSSSGAVTSALLPKGLFDEAIGKAIEHLIALYDREQASS